MFNSCMYAGYSRGLSLLPPMTGSSVFPPDAEAAFAELAVCRRPLRQRLGAALIWLGERISGPASPLRPAQELG